MSQEQLAELATPAPTAPHQLNPMPAWLEPENHRMREQFGLNHYLHHLTTTSNQKMARLAAVASANALEHDRVRIVEKQLARSQKQLLQTQQGLAAKTSELMEQKARTAKQSLMNHHRAVIKHLQGELLSDKVTAWGQEQRQSHQRGTEGLLAKQPLQPLTDIAPAYLEKSYILKVISPEKFTLTHEKSGMCFNSDERRPNGRDFLAQLRGVARPAPTREQIIYFPTRDDKIEP